MKHPVWHLYLGIALILGPLLILLAFVGIASWFVPYDLPKKTLELLLDFAGSGGIAGCLWYLLAVPFIELRYLGSIKRNPYSLGRWLRWLIVMPAVYLFLISLGEGLLDPILKSRITGTPFHLSPDLAYWLAADLPVILLTWYLFRLHRRLFRRACIRLRLCTACGYDLRGNPAGPCPECGQPVVTDPIHTPLQ